MTSRPRNNANDRKECSISEAEDLTVRIYDDEEDDGGEDGDHIGRGGLRNDTRQPKMGNPATPSEPDLLARFNGKCVVALIVAQINCVNNSRLLFLPQTEKCC